MRRFNHAKPAKKQPPSATNKPAATRMTEISSADINILHCAPQLTPYTRTTYKLSAHRGRGQPVYVDNSTRMWITPHAKVLSNSTKFGSWSFRTQLQLPATLSSSSPDPRSFDQNSASAS